MLIPGAGLGQAKSARLGRPTPAARAIVAVCLAARTTWKRTSALDAAWLFFCEHCFFGSACPLQLGQASDPLVDEFHIPASHRWTARRQDGPTGQRRQVYPVDPCGCFFFRSLCIFFSLVWQAETASASFPWLQRLDAAIPTSAAGAMLSSVIDAAGPAVRRSVAHTPEGSSGERRATMRA